MLRNYLLSSIRSLIHQRGITVINILGLAIGLTASALIILYIIHELSFDRFHENHERIFRVAVRGEISGQQLDVAVTSPPFGPAMTLDYPEIIDYTRIDFRDQKVLLSFEDMNHYVDDVIFADSSFLNIFHVPLLSGDQRTALHVPGSILLSETTARNLFGDIDPVGLSLRYNNQENLTITGVFQDYPDNSHMSFNSLIAFSSIPAWRGQEYLDAWGSLSIYTYILTGQGSDIPELERKMPEFLKKYMGEDLEESSVVFEPYLQNLADIHLQSRLMAEIQPNGNMANIYTLSAIIAFILILASINFMNLSTARSANRALEVGIRKVVGCNRTKLIVQFLGESVLISLVALILTIFLIEISLPVFNNITGKQLNMDYILNWQLTLGFLLLAIIIGILSGSYPAFYLSSFNPVRVLQGKMKAASSNKLLRNILVFIQFTVSAALMIGTFIIYKQLQYINQKELGFSKENVILISLRNQDIQEKAGIVKEGLLNLSGIRACALTNGHPGGELSGTGYFPEGFGDTDPWLIFGFDADPDFIENTMNMNVIEGRNISVDFSTDSTAVLINETLLRKLGWEDPIGRLIHSDSEENKSYKIVGVIKDFHNQSLHEKINPVIIKFLTGLPRYILVKTDNDNVPEIIEAMEGTWNSINPETPFDYQFLDDNFEHFYEFEMKLGRILTWFTIFAFFIAALGLFGLSSFAAEQRTKEIGIRKAMGSSVRSIIMILSWDFVRPILPAIFVSAPLTYWLIKRLYLQNFEYQTDIDIWIFIYSGVAALLIALITVNLQITKTASSNPVDALRYE